MLRPTLRPLRAASIGMASPLAGAEGPFACALGSTEAAARLPVHDTLGIVLTFQCTQELLACQWQAKASPSRFARQDRSMNSGATAFFC